MKMDKDKLYIPFPNSVVETINYLKDRNPPHPYTCCGPDIPECQRNSGENEGILTATTNGLVCPCGKYTQTWVWNKS